MLKELSTENHSSCRLAANLINNVAESLILDNDGNGSISVSFTSASGLFQFSVIADGNEFNWEELYVELYQYHNKGQRTGPWDFHPVEGARVLLPGYWVTVDGKELGLWYFQRAAVEDIYSKRFRGRFAFFLEKEGIHTIVLRPYKDFKITWISSVLEVDPEDRIGPMPNIPKDWMERCPAGCWKKMSFWQDLKANMETTHKLYKKPLTQSFKWIEEEKNQEPINLPLIIARYFITGENKALIMAFNIIENALKQEHWGNQKPDGYGHDGDMNAMYTFRGLSLSYHYLYNEMDDNFKKRLVDKLKLQGKRFFDKILLYRDYWGGSLLQDHGWKSLFGFGSAVLHLLGVIPEAELWAAYIIPRLDRSWEAMPQDGVIPASSHHSLYLYMGFCTHYREALLALTGRDIFEDPKILKIVDYIIAIIRENEKTSVSWGVDSINFVACCDFLNVVASRFNDGRAAYLQKLLLELPPFAFYSYTQENAYYNNAIWGVITYDPSVKPVDSLCRKCSMNVFEDSGVVHYRDANDDVVLSMRCGPSFGYNAYRKAQGPCDRLGLGPGAGHFMLAVNGLPLLMTPDSGYRLLTEIRSCMLIDGKGQKDNIGYPMSVPSYRYEGEEIQYVSWNEQEGYGQIRLNLALTYPEEMGIICYTRGFFIEKGKKIVVRDNVVLESERKLSWLFHTKIDRGIQLDGLCCRIGDKPYLNIIPCIQGAELTAKSGETPVVWSYGSSNGYKPFEFVQYDTVRPSQCVIVDFVMTWK